ncbi:hypothetical protein D3C86_1908150 [compost metagenome]
MLAARKTNIGKPCLGNALGLGCRQALDLRQRQHDVFQRRVIRKEVEMLEDHADPAAQRFRLHGKNAFTIDENIAALRLDQTV